jgi:hypothetical protein
VIRHVFAALALLAAFLLPACGDPCNGTCKEPYVCLQAAAASESQLLPTYHCVYSDPGPWPDGADAGALQLADAGDADAADAGEGGAP